jgi:hypothetical protein
LQSDDRTAEALLRLGVRRMVGAEAGTGEQELLGEQQVALTLVDRLRIVRLEACAGSGWRNCAP